MCGVARIKCEVISGYAKGYGYKPGDEIGRGETNHAWNAVEIEGQWFLVDSTWAAGSINSSNRFEKSFSNFYFLTDPEKFIVSHFPQDPKWQLLNDQINLSEFKMLVKPSKSFYEQGLSLVNYKEAVINADGEVEIQFKAPENLIFTGGLVRRNTRLEDKYIFFELI
jgi:transglutaminase/protease-like cytokinesis protein 3